MAINIGIVGLPNVGKSTLFNALSRAGAEAKNFPFCTIEPNIGVVPVPDARLKALAGIYGSRKIVPTSLEFVDIAGLVEGASRGEGLGNKFLGNIREVNAILHVVRAFSDDNVVHVSGAVDPLADVEIIETELGLADLEQVERRLSRAEKMSRAQDKAGKEARVEVALLEMLRERLARGQPARGAKIEASLLPKMHEYCLLTWKPVIYVANLSEAEVSEPHQSKYYQALDKYAREQGAPCIAICAALEVETQSLPEAERDEYLEALGLREPGLDKVVRAGYRALGLRTYLTAGPQESRAWTIDAGALAPQAAGVIHSDFERGFIKAEVMNFEELMALGSEAAVKQAGKMRIEGKEYEVQEGDVVLFRFNV